MSWAEDNGYDDFEPTTVAESYETGDGQYESKDDGITIISEMTDQHLINAYIYFFNQEGRQNSLVKDLKLELRLRKLW